MRDYARFDAFLDRFLDTVYAEGPAGPAHATITRMTIENLHGDGLIAGGQTVLDIGCGEALALELFRDLGLHGTGVTLSADDAAAGRAKGFDVREMDQNFLDFPDHGFDVLWCRHILEHSVAPLYTLAEYRRLVKPDGVLYIEVPAPDTAAHHELNPNHPSVLPASTWRTLFQRAGLTIVREIGIDFETDCGRDTYYSFVLRPVADVGP